MADRLLLRGGSVISMDAGVGDLPKGDVLIEGEKIARVAPSIDADTRVEKSRDYLTETAAKKKLPPVG